MELSWRIQQQESEHFSDDCLINDDDDSAYFSHFEINNTKRDKFKIALMTTVILSAVMAGAAIVLLISSSNQLQSSRSEELYVVQPVNSVRVLALRLSSAKVIITRNPFEDMQLDLEFQGVSDYGAPESCEAQVPGSLQCVSWPGAARLTLTDADVKGAECFNISLDIIASNGQPNISTCLSLSDRQLYGGPVFHKQRWPSQNSPPLHNTPYLSSYDGIAGKAERFWVTSKGEAIFVPPYIPLFVTQNTTHLCLESRLAPPYHRSGVSNVTFEATFCGASDARQVTVAASKALLGTPSSPPDSRMLKYPVWSTWAEYKTKIDQKTVIKFAHDIQNFGFPNSQIEIDDRWEPCYGDLDFDNTTFPNPKEMVDTLHKLGYRVTLWIHPFLNRECQSYTTAKELNLLIHRFGDNATDGVKWWNGEGGLLDFTNPASVQWFQNRVENLRKMYNFDGFKFDAGDANFIPELAILHGPEALQPASMSTEYAKTAARIGPGIAEMRSLFLAQKFPLVLRMDDKSSDWGYNNGLQTLIPVILTLNMVGYSTVMPDMIGGNGYGNKPDKELFIRWMQANTFMPIMQFSFTPWDYDNETVAIAKTYVDLHAKYADLFISLAHRKMIDGSPINPPLWWIAPDDSIAQTIDSEFLVGERLLVAPVLQKGSTSRDVYLPAGTWKEGLRPDSPHVEGPIWLKNHSAPLDYLPFFERVDTDIADFTNVVLAL